MSAPQDFARKVQDAIAAVPHGADCPVDVEFRCTCREQRIAARVAAAIDAAWDYATEVTTPRLKETRAAALRALTHEAP